MRVSGGANRCCIFAHLLILIARSETTASKGHVTEYRRLHFCTVHFGKQLPLQCLSPSAAGKWFAALKHKAKVGNFCLLPPDFSLDLLFLHWLQNPQNMHSSKLSGNWLVESITKLCTECTVCVCVYM